MTPSTPSQPQHALFVQGLSIEWDKVDPGSYLRRIPALSSLNTLEFRAPVTLFAGENGTGKSTLLEALAVACGFNAEGGTLNYRFSTYRDVSELEEFLHVNRGLRKRNSGYFFRAESFFNVATAAVTSYQSKIDYHAQSHGESFLTFLQGDTREGIYLMDEPEAALSPQRQLALIVHICQMAAEGSQFVIATHSPILLGIPGAQILEFSQDGIAPIAYEDTESYQITRLFLENRELVLHQLLDQPE